MPWKRRTSWAADAFCERSTFFGCPGPKQGRARCGRRAVSAAFFFSRSPSFTHCPHQSRSPIRGNFLDRSDWLSLRRNRRRRVRHLADLGNSQLLIAWCWQTDLFRVVECTSHLSLSRNIHLNSTQHSCHLRPQRFGSVNQQKQLSYVGPAKKPWEMDPRARRPRVCEHCLSRPPSGHQASTTKDAILEAMQEHARLGRSAASPRVARRSDSGYSNVDFELSQVATSRAALKGTAGCPSERIKQYSGVRVSRNNQLFPSLHFAIISLAHPATTQKNHSDVSSPLSLKTLCCNPHAQHDSGQRQSNRRMVIAGACSPLRSPIMLRQSVPRFRGRIPACGQCHQKRSRTRDNEAPAPSTRLTKEDERRRNSISATERIGESAEHDQAGDRYKPDPQPLRHRIL